MTIIEFFIYFTGALFILLGILHFIKPKFYLNIMPSFFPFKEFLNYASGLVEVILGIGVFIPSIRQPVSYGIILLLISFLLVHVSHLFEEPKGMQKVKHKKLILWIRLILQFVLIYWIYVVSNN
jgi:uncharacterized membrane protein